MAQSTVAPYGSWKSPITADLIVKESVGLSQVTVDGDDIYWIEGRPSESGRQVIVRQSADGTRVDVNPPALNARTRVHEYGGGDYVAHDGVVYFSNFTDQQLYRQQPNSQTEVVTSDCADDHLRYADTVVDPQRRRLICVCEDHRRKDREAENYLAAVSLSDGKTTRLVFGNDFYSSPRLSPNGSRLAWLTWNHPNMPWDGCELWTGDIAADGSIINARLVAGGSRESIFQPEWSPDGILHFVSDRTGWWNIYRATDGAVTNVCEIESEFGVPQWVFGLSTYAFESVDRIVCAFVEQGIWRLGTIDIAAKQLKRIQTSFTEISFVRALPGRAVFRAGSATAPFSVCEMDLETGELKILRRANQIEVDPGYISPAVPVEFPTENGLTAHGFYYAPKNKDYAGPPAERPPLLVKSHGGPTSATIAVLMPSIQYWTSRGIAVLDVNYGGSTGYGRAYRERLNGTWGIVDVDDCINGARFLAQRGDTDADVQ